MTTTYKEQEYATRFDFKLWKKLIKLLAAQKKLMIILGVFMVIVAAIDAIFPLMSKYAIDTFIVPQKTSGLGRFVFFYFCIIVIQAVNILLLIIIAGKIDMGICYYVRKKGFEQLQKLSFSYYDRTPVGWIMSRMTSDCQKLSSIISWGLVDMIWGGTLMVAIGVCMLILNWKLAIIVLCVVPGLVFISIWFQQKILKFQRIVRKSNSRITGAYNEGIIGAKTTKALVREEANLKEFNELTNSMKVSSVRSAIFSSLYLPIVLTLGSVGTGLVLWRGGDGVFNGTITYGTLVAFLSYTVFFFDPVRELARVLVELQSAQASAERIFSMIESEPVVKDTAEVVERYGSSLNPKISNFPKPKGYIEFKNVSFSYGKGDVVLKDFNFSVQKGETIALIGETGSGKSTIVNLACRFYEPTEGKILVDCVDYRERSLHWLQSNLGYVLQTPHLFSGTIRENIRYGKLSSSDEEIYRAAKLVYACEFIEKKQNGYDTEVGEDGALLSTGEKQLISFARAILADPVFFILDEATSSVDTETEYKIQAAIKTILINRTSIIIAHRLSTIKSADRILVLQKGRILEQGNHHSLLKQKGYYYRLYTNQFIEGHESELVECS